MVHWKKSTGFLGGGSKYGFVFTPNWENDPIWRAYFSNGLKPPSSFILLKFNMQPENKSLEKEIPYFKAIMFRFHVSNRKESLVV